MMDAYTARRMMIALRATMARQQLEPLCKGWWQRFKLRHTPDEDVLAVFDRLTAAARTTEGE